MVAVTLALTVTVALADTVTVGDGDVDADTVGDAVTVGDADAVGVGDSDADAVVVGSAANARKPAATTQDAPGLPPHCAGDRPLVTYPTAPKEFTAPYADSCAVVKLKEATGSPARQ